jgi:hypothetical protein
MTLTLGSSKNTKTGAFPLCPVGLHQAVCFAVYDLGTQMNEKYDKELKKILVIWELPLEKRDETHPFHLMKIYTASLFEKAQLRKDLESWRGRQFKEQELQSFDLKNILGTNCMLQVIHADVGGRTYANIAAITVLPKGLSLLKATEKLVFFEIESASLPEGIPPWIATKILDSKEWKARSQSAP